jgi:beta-glucosidase
MGTAEIRGIQSQHVIAQVKHFVGYDTDAGNVWIDDQTLHEVYVAPFAAAVVAGVASLMCSYNRLNGKFACGNESTLTEGGVLPLKSADLDQVVLIGPGAGQVMAIGISGERSLGLPERQIGPLEAMRKISGNSKIRFAVDDDMTGSTVPARAFSHDGQTGLERIDASGGGTQTDSQLNFTVKGGNALPPNSTLTWKGTLTVSDAGNYWIYLQALGTNASISIDDKRLGATGAVQGAVHGDILQANQDNAVATTDSLDNVRRAIDLTQGAHAIEVQITPDTSNAPVQVRLNWYTPEQRKADHEAAIAAARIAKVAVVFLWTRLNPAFGLPGRQNELVLSFSSPRTYF